VTWGDFTLLLSQTSSSKNFQNFLGLFSRNSSRCSLGRDLHMNKQPLDQPAMIRRFVIIAAASTLLLGASLAPAASPTIYSLNGGSDGKIIYGRVVEGANGTFYGVAQQGGANGVGTVFKVTSAGAFNTLYSFGTSADDGAFPSFGGLLKASDGNFYGTTSSGGTSGSGTLFKLTAGGALTTLYAFGSKAGDGSGTKATLIQGSDGALYGVAQQGGANGTGTVFKAVTDGTVAGTTVTTLHPFAAAPAGTNADGAQPLGSLVQGSDGNFYGTTLSGGSVSEGTIFKITSVGGFTTLYSFTFSNYAVRGGLIQASDGNFYGTSGSDNNVGRGTVFKVVTNGTAAGTTVTTLYQFGNPPDGGAPADKLFEGSDGNFYGTTESGGLGSGAVFKVTPGGTETILYSFGTNSGDGGDPFAELVLGSDGNLYGTTKAGGGGSAGTIFKIAGPAALTPPPPPPHGGLSSTVFTVNGKGAPSNNVADTALRFLALQTGTPGGLTVRVQATTTPNTEQSWTDLANDRGGRMIFDAARNQFVLNSTDYPLQNGVYFRAISVASAYTDSISNVVGPFNLANAKPHLSPTRLSITFNSSIADLYFRVTKSTVESGVALRIQTTTTPADESSWADLNNGNAGHNAAKH
jgi:uncharacterized repeat protein (TIGR03803 family)